MDLLLLDPTLPEPLYIQLYQQFRRQIEQGSLSAGEKLPSIRSLARQLTISKITVEKAYLQLMSEGYIENGNRSRYTVSPFEPSVAPVAKNPLPAARIVSPLPAPPIRYDFASGEMDGNGFNFPLWKRYINKVFARPDQLTGYGHYQGELELRQELARYLQSSRGVAAHPEQIVIGAGVQNLLHMLCSLLKPEHTSIAFEEPGFKNGRRIFADNSFTIIPVGMNADGLNMQELQTSQTRLVYLSPSHQFPTGYIMPIGQRHRLLAWAKTAQGTIIEDDYDSEFRYFGRPIPALQGLDRDGSVIYVGSLSKLIPPSIRISYMVLPPRLLYLYQKNSALYNQSASTLEQLALAAFMADGHFERQIRRLRKLYQEKSLLFYETIQRCLGDRATINMTDSGLHTILNLQTTLSTGELVTRARQQGCRVVPIEEYYWENPPGKLPQIILYFSKIPRQEIQPAIELLRSAWFDKVLDIPPHIQ